jgi:hypothetical protein
MILYPERRNQQPSITYVGAIGSILLYTGCLDLGAADMQAEENQFAFAVLETFLH